MQDLHNPFITKQFLKSVWALDYAAYKDSAAEQELDDRLRRWAARADLRERAAQAAFIEEFFPPDLGLHPGRAGRRRSRIFDPSRLRHP